MKRIRFFILGIAIMFMIGCSHAYTEAPKATNHWFSEQYMIQAAHHWDMLAFSVSNNILSLVDHQLNLPKDIYIAPAADSVFEKNYREYLKSHLTGHGFVICPDDTCPIVLNFHTNTVHHPTFPVYTGYRSNPEKRYNHLQKSELVVVNDIYSQDLIIGTFTKTLYFKDGELNNYAVRVKEIKEPVPTRSYNVTGIN